MTKERRQTGRPRVEIDDAKLRGLMRFNPSLADTAAFFECSADTVERHIKRTHALTFAAFRDQNMVHVRLKLVQLALKKAETDKIMLIFCLKNLCGWADKIERDDAGDERAPLRLNYAKKAKKKEGAA